MHVYCSAQSRHIQAPLDIVRHPRLSGDAKSLLLWVLSLPPEERDTLTAVGVQMPFGQKAFSNARKQLIAEGYVLTRSWQDRRGKWSSAVIVSDVPILDPDEVQAAWVRALAEHRGRKRPEPPPEEPDETPLAEMPEQALEEPPPADEEPPDDSPGGAGWAVTNWSFLRRRPRPDAAPPGPDLPRADGPALREGRTREVFPSLPRAEQEFEDDEPTRILRRIVAKDLRLWLRPGDAVELAPLVGEWLARGVTERELQSALLDGLPVPIFHPPKLFRDRLLRKMPPPREPVRAPKVLHECTECCDPVPQPGLCRPCAGVPARVSPWAAERAETTRRGASMARAAFAPRAPLPV
jgi:hypothetical protein